MTEETKLLNLTPHDIVVLSTDPTTFKRSGLIARVSQAPAKFVSSIRGATGGSIWVVEPPTFDKVEWPDDLDLADNEGVIVSMLVGQAICSLPADQRPRFAVYGPDTSPESVVRDESGNIKGVNRLIRYWDPQDEMQ